MGLLEKGNILPCYHEDRHNLKYFVAGPGAEADEYQHPVARGAEGLLSQCSDNWGDRDTGGVTSVYSWYCSHHVHHWQVRDLVMFLIFSNISPTNGFH